MGLGVSKSPRTALFVCLSLTLLLAACAPEEIEPQATNVTVYEGARVIPGDGSAPIEDAVLVVGDGRIMAVGPRGEVAAPEGAPRVDLTGKTVMPAIVDTHKHFAVERDALIDQLERLAYWGVGVAASLGQDTGDLAFQVRDEINPNAARLKTAGRGIVNPEPGRTEAPYWVTSADEARQAVRELAGRRVDIVKIWVDDRNGMYEKLGPEIYTAVIEEAHANNLRVTAHIFALEDAKGLMRAGLDAFAHGVRDTDVDDEFIAMLRERPSVVLAPNLPNRGVAVDMSWLDGTIPAEQLAEMQANSTDRPAAQEGFALQARNMMRMKDAGVAIAFGTDGSTPYAPHEEMVDMVAAGMTPAEVIVAATSNSAALLQMTDVGAIESGKSADFIVLDANPLDDITNTRRISAVYLRGEAVDRDGLRTRWMAAVSSD